MVGRRETSPRDQSMWNAKYATCQICETTESPHMAKGKCSRCYQRAYRGDPKNQTRIKQAKSEWYDRNRDAQIIDGPQLRDQKHFSGNRQRALDAADHQCACCGAEEQLVVHHLDHNGRGKATPNNDLDNLEVLCRACHAREHRELRGRWSVRHEACVDCGTTSTPHNAKGKCRVCYSAWYSQNGRKI